MSDTPTLKVPAADVPSKLRAEVTEILTEMAPLVAAQVERKRRQGLRSLVDALTVGVSLREVDIRQARMQANAIQAILESAEWLTAAEIGRLGNFSQSNPAAPANRWKNDGKIFAIEHGGQDRFPRYALDEAFRPLQVVEQVLATLGKISPWRIAAWFDSTNAWLDNRRPRDVLAVAPEQVLRAAEAYRSGGHG